MSGLTYDAGMLIAAEDGASQAWLLHKRVLARGVVPIVPVVVLAQAWRGGPQPLLSRLLRGCDVLSVHEVDARLAGTALGRAGTADVVDALVVVGALRRGDAVVTSDAADLQRLARALGGRLVTHRV